MSDVERRATEVEMKTALYTALVAMKIASALPGVAEEYDFEPAITQVIAALFRARGIRAAGEPPTERSPRHYDSQGYCDNPGRGY